MFVRRMLEDQRGGGIAALNEVERLRARAGLIATFRIVLSLVILAYLVRRVSEVGWEQVGQSFPENPWFYVLSVAIYALLPLSEIVIYELILKTPLWRDLSVFLRKRVYNFAVFGYSGEAWFILWLRRRLALTHRRAISAVKDNNVLSALVSNTAAVVLSGTLLLSGRLESLFGAVSGAQAYTAAFAVAGVVSVPVVLRFYHNILGIKGSTAAAVVTLHILRVLAVQGLMAVQWSIALPQVPFQTWLIFLAAQMLLTRVPFLPNQDLVVLGLGLSMAGVLSAPTASVAGMFVAAGMVTQCLHLLVYVLTSFDSSIRFGPRVPEASA